MIRTHVKKIRKIILGIFRHPIFFSMSAEIPMTFKSFEGYPQNFQDILYYL